MTTRIGVSARNAAATAIATLLDGGAAAGKIEIRTGSQPATPATAASGTLLATLTLTDPAFGAASTGVVTAATITGDSSADATGTAGWFRAMDSNNVAIIDGSVTATGGGGDLTLNSVSIVAGGTVNVTSWTITMPG